jgi:FkbM family methyltransferase
MISYAQNFEDILLWRALKNIKKGVYIDIGAQDPEIDSISLSFYQKGWRGINVEPNEYYFNLLKIARPDEIVEQLVVSDQNGTIPFYEIPSTGLSTADINIAKKHKANGFDFIKKEVKAASLDFIFNMHSLSEVHWLKIDVEGFEKSVLDSWKNSECRPWIILIESTEPLSQTENYPIWEAILFDKNYQFVYFDGLNRFYIHKDHVELAEYFKVPVNVFDNFMLSGLANHDFHRLFTAKAKESEAKAKAKESEAKAKESEAKAKESEAKAKESKAKAQQAHVQLNDVYRSKSWRITAPIRLAVHRLCLMRDFLIMTRIRTVAKKLILIGIVFSLKNPRLKKQLIFLANRLGVLERLKRIYLGVTTNSKFSGHFAASTIHQLSPKARQIYNDFMADLKSSSGDNC